MAFTYTKTLQVNGNGLSRSTTTSYAYGGNPQVDENIPDGSSNLAVDCVFKYAALCFIAIFATGTLTLQAKTSGGVSVGDPITVTSVKEFSWGSDYGTNNPFDANVAYFAVTNASGADVTLSILPLTDPTV